METSLFGTTIASPSNNLIFWDWLPSKNKLKKFKSVEILPPPFDNELFLITLIFVKSEYEVIPLDSFSAS